MSTLTIERVFDAPVERVWQMFTNADEIKKWWGPQYWTCPSAQLDLKVGGKYLYCMRGAMGPGMPETEHWSGGEFKEIVENERIVATDYFTDENGNRVSPATLGLPGTWAEEMLVTFAFEGMGDKTKLTIVHEGHPEEMMANATLGWNQSLDKLAAAL